MTMGLAGMFRYFGIPGGPGGGLVYHTVYRPDGWQGIMEAASTQPDDAKRMEQIIALRKIIFDESMAIPLWTAPMISALDQSVQDSHWYEGHQMYYDAENIWLKK
jgi:ABC-type transport system substrate-binding protein